MDGWILALDGAPNPKPTKRRSKSKRRPKMARAKRGKNGRFLKKRKASSKKRKNPSKKKRVYRKRKSAKRKNPSRKRRKTYAKKRRNPSRKRRTYRKRRNPTSMKVAGLDVKDIAMFTGALIGVEYANNMIFKAAKLDPKLRVGWMGGLAKLATALGLAFALKKLKVCGASGCKAIQLAGVTHAALAVANEAVMRVPALRGASPQPVALGERQYRLLGERTYRALGSKPAHLSGKRARYGSSLPRHLVSRAGK